MQCPRCGNNNSRVIDSRPADNGGAIRRRRECEQCLFRFTTFERIEVAPLVVIKKNGDREEFNRKKILAGLLRASEKRKISTPTLNKVVTDVENKVRSLGESEVSSQVIGQSVIKEIKNIDDIAYIRFASVYQQFNDTTEFLQEIEKILEEKKTNDQ